MGNTRVLPSALPAEEAQKTRERIEKGFEKEIPAPVADTASMNQQAANVIKTATAKAKGKRAGQASLFSSDSDESEGGEEEKKDESANEKPTPAPAAAKSAAKAKPQEKAPNTAASETGTAAPSTITTIQAPATKVTPVEPKQQPKPRRLPVVSDTKRPLPRASRIPDLSFFPREVGLICKRISAHTTRSAVLDEEDYATFVQQHEGFRADWETLDKVTTFLGFMRPLVCEIVYLTRTCGSCGC